MDFFLQELNRYAHKENNVVDLLQSNFSLLSSYFSIKSILCFKIENKSKLQILSSDGLAQDELEFKKNAIRKYVSILS